jgi:hypothetical protein
MIVAAVADRGLAGVDDPGYRNQLSFFAAARGLGTAVTTGEFLDPAGGIDEFLFAGEKRMTTGADADFNITPRRPRVINRAARADDIGLVIFRMNARFHVRRRARNVSARANSRKG